MRTMTTGMAMRTGLESKEIRKEPLMMIHEDPEEGKEKDVITPVMWVSAIFVAFLCSLPGRLWGLLMFLVQFFRNSVP